MDLNDIAKSLVMDADPIQTDQQDQVDAADAEILTDEQPENQVEEMDNDEAEDEFEETDPNAEEVDAFTLTIDGEERQVSVDELVQSYQIDGAARKRLQEATEMRTRAVEEGRAEGMSSASAEIETGRTEITQQRAQLGELIGLVGPQLFAPRVNRPDPSMEHSDPIGFLTDMERWRQDQGRIQGLQQQLSAATIQQREQVEDQKAQAMANNRHQLSTKRPDLADPTKQAAFTQNVRVAQEAVGFTNAEVNAFPDHRGLLILDMLGERLAREQAGGPDPAQRVLAKTKTPMAPQAVQYKRTKVQKQRRADHDRAKKSGDYRDVAKLLMTEAPKR